ncbi:MAG: hypothetical protein JWO38_2492 [Gemmataceae bacterium]|nr:hypothetical protein [Gemmataceae bacterium]
MDDQSGADTDNQPRGPAAWVARWVPIFSRWLGWLPGVMFFIFGFGELPLVVRVGLWLFGADLFLTWVIERVEARRNTKMMGLRKALLPLLFAAPLLVMVGGIGWLLGAW